MPVTLVGAVKQSSVPSWAFSGTTGHNRSTRKMKDCVVPLLKDAGDLVMKDVGKAQLLNVFLALVHWRGPLSGLLNTCGWWQCLVE